MAPVVVPKKPGVAGIVLGIVLMVVGPIIGAIIIAVAALGGVVSGAISVANAPDYVADATDYYPQATAGTTMAFWFPANASATCAVVDPNSNQITPRQQGYSSDYNDLQVVLVFDATVTGTYNVACQSDGAPFNYKVAPALLTANSVGPVIAGVLIIVVTFLGGLILLIISIVRRSHWTKENGAAAQAAVYPPQQPIYPPQQPPAGYPPQAYPPQQPPAYPPQQ